MKRENYTSFHYPSRIKPGWVFFILFCTGLMTSHTVQAQQTSKKGQVSQSSTQVDGLKESARPESIPTSNFESRQPQPAEWINLYESPRVISEIDLSKHDQLTLNRMTSNGRGVLAFLDYSDEQIVLYDTNQNPDSARFIKIGHGVGNKTSEFGNTFDIKFYGLNELIVTDIMHNRISRWDVNGNFIDVMVFEDIVPSRLTICPDGSLYILLQNYARKGMIARVSMKSGKVEKIFQKINRFDLQSVFHRDGSLTCHDSELVYSAYYFDFLKRYTPAGEVKYSRTLSGFKPNDVLIEQGNNELGSFIRRSPEARRSVGELIIYEDILFVGFSGNSDGLMRRIDLYDPLSGFYLGTIPMEVPFEEFVLDQTGFYVLTPPTESRPPHIIHYSWDWDKRIPRATPDLLDHNTVSGKTSSKP